MVPWCRPAGGAAEGSELGYGASGGSNIFTYAVTVSKFASPAAHMGRRRKGGGCRSSSSSAGRDREAERACREQARSEQLAEAQARRDARRHNSAMQRRSERDCLSSRKVLGPQACGGSRARRPTTP